MARDFRYCRGGPHDFSPFEGRAAHDFLLTGDEPMPRLKSLSGIPQWLQREWLVEDRVRSYNREHKRPGQHDGPITMKYREVLVALLRHFQQTKSNALPATGWLAAEVHCSRSTVSLALKAVTAAGLTDWARSVAGTRGEM